MNKGVIYLFVSICCLVFSSCSTVKLPLGGVNINHPKPMSGKFGFRAGGGYAPMPRIEGTVPAVYDADGSVVNPIPATDDKLFNLPVPNIDTALGIAGWVDVGVSVNRGTYVLAKLFEAGHWTFSISPAYFSSTSTTSDKKAEGRARNLNATFLTCFDFIPKSPASIFLYAGAGANFHKTTITSKIPDTDITVNSAEYSTITPNILAGAGGRLFILDLTLEAAVTSLRQRDGRRDLITTVSALGSLVLF